MADFTTALALAVKKNYIKNTSIYICNGTVVGRTIKTLYIPCGGDSRWPQQAPLLRPAGDRALGR